MNTFFLPPKALSFTLVFLTVFIIRCGSFQGASYYAADGIYSNGTTTVVKRVETRSPSNNGAYYSEYFQNLTDEYSSTESYNDNAYFVDTENYGSVNTNDNAGQSVAYNQAPWGGNTTRTEVYVYNNTPWNNWGLSNFAYGYSPYWNSYYSPYRYGWSPYNYYYNSYNPYNPYVYGDFYNPYGYGGYYNPYYGYGYGYGWNRWNRWNRWDRWNRWGNHGGYGYGYARNGNHFRDVPLTRSKSITRMNSNRGEKNYSDSRSKNKSASTEQSSSNKDAEVRSTLNRINSGRRINGTSFGNSYLSNPAGSATI